MGLRFDLFSFDFLLSLLVSCEVFDFKVFEVSVLNDNSNNQVCYDDDEIDLLDLLLVLARNKFLIFGLTTLFAVVSIAAALLMTPVYKATSRVLPPGASSGGGMSAMMKAALPSLGGLGGPSPGDVVASLAKSRAVMDPLIEEFDLMEHYEQESLARTRNALSEALSATSDSKSGLISFSIMDKDPEFAATLANALVVHLQAFMQKIALSDVAQERLFLEAQVKEAQLNLIEAENGLAAYQKKTGVLDAMRETSSMVGAMASFRARVAAKEVQLKSLQTFATSNNPKSQQLQAEIAGLKQELRKIEERAQGQEGLSPVSAEELPDLGTEYIRRLRDLRFAETLYGMLLKQYEDARMREASNPTLIQVIDPAVAPELRSKPNRKLMVVLATVLGFFVSIFAAFVREFVRNAGADPERAEKLVALRHHLTFRRKPKAPPAPQQS